MEIIALVSNFSYERSNVSTL